MGQRATISSIFGTTTRSGMVKGLWTENSHSFVAIDSSTNRPRIHFLLMNARRILAFLSLFQLTRSECDPVTRHRQLNKIVDYNFGRTTELTSDCRSRFLCYTVDSSNSEL